MWKDKILFYPIVSESSNQMTNFTEKFRNKRFFNCVLIIDYTINLYPAYTFDFDPTGWRLFQKHVVDTQFDIYVLISKRCFYAFFNTVLP